MSTQINDVKVTSSTIDSSPIGSSSPATGVFITPSAGDNSQNAATTQWVRNLLAGFAPSGGSVLLPGGLIIKWGQTPVFDTGPVTVTFPTAFPTACVWVGLTDDFTLDNSTRLWAQDGLFANFFIVRNDGLGGADWLAVGY